MEETMKLAPDDLEGSNKPQNEEQGFEQKCRHMPAKFSDGDGKAVAVVAVTVAEAWFKCCRE